MNKKSVPRRHFLLGFLDGTTDWHAVRSRWNHFWFRTGPPHLLAVFRIVFGGFLLVYFGMQIPNIAMLYSRDGLLLPRGFGAVFGHTREGLA